jgi:hypothetical protein
MTLLQFAREHADHPDLAAMDLKQERRAGSVADAALDGVVGRSRKGGPDTYLIPPARRIHDHLLADVHRMLAPLRAQASPARANGCHLVAGDERHLDEQLAQASSLAEDRISETSIDRLTSRQQDAGNSLDLWVMDLHEVLNLLQQQLANETIDGAIVYGVREGNRPLIAAFMAGINQRSGRRKADTGSPRGRALEGLSWEGTRLHLLIWPWRLAGRGFRLRWLVMDLLGVFERVALTMGLGLMGIGDPRPSACVGENPSPLARPATPRRRPNGVKGG